MYILETSLNRTEEKQRGGPSASMENEQSPSVLHMEGNRKDVARKVLEKWEYE